MRKTPIWGDRDRLNINYMGGQFKHFQQKNKIVPFLYGCIFLLQKCKHLFEKKRKKDYLPAIVEALAFKQVISPPVAAPTTTSSIA